MFSISDPRNNPLLASLKIQATDRIISVRETGNIDSNFILTHLIKQVFHEHNKLLLVSLHNTLDHYQTVGRKLGYDLKRNITEDKADILEPLDDIAFRLIEGEFLDDKEEIVKCLFRNIQSKIAALSLNSKEKLIYLVIDDLSHLLDLGVDIPYIISFINYCNTLVDTENVAIVINTHVCNKIDEIISNTLQYVSDVHIEVAPLKTGLCNEVTGVINIERVSGKSQYQYKAFDRGVRTFHPGQAIYHLYK